MITVPLTKLESALDGVRKAYPKLVPADAALIASALTLTGRHALATNNGEQFTWPEDNDKLMKSLSGEIRSMSESLAEAAPAKVTKKAAAAALLEEEPVSFNVGLLPNLSAGERLLEGREDLKTLLADILQEGVEFSYSGQDIGWQWALDRANWQTIVEGGDVSRRVKAKAVFTEGAVGVETGTTIKKKKAPVAKAATEPDLDTEE